MMQKLQSISLKSIRMEADYDLSKTTQMTWHRIKEVLTDVLRAKVICNI